MTGGTQNDEDNSHHQYSCRYHIDSAYAYGLRAGRAGALAVKNLENILSEVEKK
jgi:hypothetical protein